MPSEPTPKFDLRTHHYSWIVDAAITHFEEAIERAENRIVRHEHLRAEPTSGRFVKSREEEIASARSFLSQYREIMRFLVAMKERVSTMAAEEGAREIAEFLAEDRARSRRRRPR